MKALILLFLMCWAAACGAAPPSLYASTYPNGPDLPDAVVATVSSGAPLSCVLEPVAGGVRPKCDIAALPVGQHLITLAVSQAGQRNSGPSQTIDVTVIQPPCAGDSASGRLVICERQYLIALTTEQKAQQWRTPPGAARSLFKAASGRLVGPIPRRAAPGGAACDAAAHRIQVGASVYLPLAGGPADEVAQCLKVSP